MLFLIEYDRGREELVTFQAFPDEQQKEANEARLELELHDNRLGLGREIDILGAPTEAQIPTGYRVVPIPVVLRWLLFVVRRGRLET